MAPFGVPLLVAASRKTHVFSIQKNEKQFFLLNKLEPRFGNIVRHHRTEACAQFWHIIRNYSTDAAISLLVWLESHESSFMVGRFLEHFLKNAGIASLVFLLVGRPHLMM